MPNRTRVKAPPVGIQEIPGLVEAAAGHDLEFRVRVEFGDETPPEPDAVARIDALLAEASEELELG